MAQMWAFSLVRLAGILLSGLCLGALIGPIWLWLLAAACLYIAWQLFNLYRLDRWLRLRSQLDPPNIGGIWGDIIGQVVRLHRRKQFHKQRLVQLFRELRRSTAALPDGVIILSTQNEIVWFNRQAARLLGLRRPVDIGLRIDNLIRSPEFVLYLHGDDFAMPLIIRPPVQAELYLALQLVPYGGGQSLLLVRDVTRQMRLEAMRKDFVANASHELRTPLTVISGYLDTMADDFGVDQAWAGPIRDMRAQAQRMNAIITDLLELSRLESADGEAPREPIDVPGMLERMHRDALAGSGRPRHVLLELESADGLFGAPHEIESAFTNLLVNGLKYTPVDGTVRMRWWIDEDGAHFAVIDTGIGISAEHIPRLTERFYRVDAGRSRGEGGSGLGLAIVKHAMQRHGGWLDVRSTEGKGSAFTCHFPAQRINRLGPRAAADDRDTDPGDIEADASDMDTDAGDVDADAGRR
ncbi:MAG TPA: phosphate regulon sensor histidine kinase PhoR [Steroidobacteraceae bacterium]|nr:phosphate regulon sensor histidine kinase PhoR [Steroidobacteraceae bacterium]